MCLELEFLPCVQVALEFASSSEGEKGRHRHNLIFHLWLCRTPQSMDQLHGPKHTQSSHQGQPLLAAWMSHEPRVPRTHWWAQCVGMMKGWIVGFQWLGTSGSWVRQCLLDASCCSWHRSRNLGISWLPPTGLLRYEWCVCWWLLNDKTLQITWT